MYFAQSLAGGSNDFQALIEPFKEQAIEDLTSVSLVLSLGLINFSAAQKLMVMCSLKNPKPGSFLIRHSTYSSIRETLLILENLDSSNSNYKSSSLLPQATDVC